PPANAGFLWSRLVVAPGGGAAPGATAGVGDSFKGSFVAGSFGRSVSGGLYLVALSVTISVGITRASPPASMYSAGSAGPLVFVAFSTKKPPTTPPAAPTVPNTKYGQARCTPMAPIVMHTTSAPRSPPPTMPLPVGDTECGVIGLAAKAGVGLPA